MNTNSSQIKPVDAATSGVDQSTAPSTALAVRDLTVAYHQKPVVWDVDVQVPSGSLAAVVGPNGAGKSTLIKACLGLIPKTSGEVRIDEQSYNSQRSRVGYVPQRESVDWDFPVSALDVVTMGTYGKLGWFRRVNKRSKALALQALDRVGLADFADRQISQLSGGQQQRTFLARALVQDADLYFMDEPFAAVDAATEQAIVVLLKDLQARGKTCLVVHHDLATVPQYFDWTILLNMRVVANGPTSEVFTKENLNKTYGGQLTLLSEVADKWIRNH